MNQLIIPKPKITKVLKAFRTQYNLTQQSAARWMLLPAGTYRDYEQGRSEPVPLLVYAMHARIRDYEREYAKYCALQRDDRPEAITDEPVFASAWSGGSCRRASQAPGDHDRPGNGRHLAKENLPGIVTTLAVFPGATCKPKGWKEILRIIRDEVDLDAAATARARKAYQVAGGQANWQTFALNTSNCLYIQPSPY